MWRAPLLLVFVILDVARPTDGGGRGVALCCHPEVLRGCMVQVLNLEPYMGKGLDGAEIFHVGELGDEHVRAVAVASNHTTVVDLGPKLMEQYRIGADQLGAFRGYRCKPMAVVHSRFDEVMLIDADVALLLPPPALFRAQNYERFGAMLFRDQKTLTRNNREDGTSMPHLRKLLHKLWAEFQAGGDPVPGLTNVPPPYLRNTPLWQGLTYDVGESSMVLWNKRRLAHPTRRLVQLHRQVPAPAAEVVSRVPDANKLVPLLYHPIREQTRHRSRAVQPNFWRQRGVLDSVRVGWQSDRPIAVRLRCCRL